MRKIDYHYYLVCAWNIDHVREKCSPKVLVPPSFVEPLHLPLLINLHNIKVA